MSSTEPFATATALYADLPVSVLGEPVRAVRKPGTLAKSGQPCDGFPIQPVVDARKRLIGVLAMSAEPDPEVPIGQLLSDFPRLVAGSTLAHAQMHFAQHPCAYIPLVDFQGRYTGFCASRQRLIDFMSGHPRPVRIGGLATPLGVYMTSGAYTAGAGWQGLIATGLLFGVVAHVLDLWILVVYSALTAVFPVLAHMGEGLQLTIDTGLMLCTLLMLLRLSPMSGLHAAEHMTINAIERDLPVTLPVVRQQSRAHPRCGTNLMVLLAGLQLVGLFLYTSGHAMNPLGQWLYGLGGLALVWKNWQRVGIWLQTHFTTQVPTDAQLESGLKAGRELLEQYRLRPHAYPGFWPRLWHSGMITMAISFAASAWVIQRLLDALWGGQ